MAASNFKTSTLFRELKILADLLTNLLKVMPKVYSFSIGEKMIDKSVSILYSTSMAYDADDRQEKITYICKAKKDVLAYESFVESLKMYDAISPKPYTKFFHVLGSIKAKLNNWEKSLAKKN